MNMKGFTAQLIRQLSAAANQRTDGDLLDGFLTHNVEADFAELVHRYGSMVWGVCRRALPDHTDAEDAFQTVFLVLVRRGKKLVGQHNIGPWLHRVAVWTIRNIRRRNAHRLSRRVMLSEELPVVLSDRDLSLDLDNALLTLPEKFRSSIVLCHLLGYSRADAAAQLGCPEGTLSSWLARGMSKLRTKLSDLDPARMLGITAVAVPAGLSVSVVRAAVAFNSTAAISLGLSSAIPQLVEGVIRMLWVKKATATTVALFIVFACGIGVGVSTFQLAPAAEGQEKTTLVNSAVSAETPKGSNVADEDLKVDKILAELQDQLQDTNKQCAVVEEAVKESTRLVKVYQLESMIKKNQNQPTNPDDLKKLLDTRDQFQKDLDTLWKKIDELKDMIQTLEDYKIQHEKVLTLKARQMLETYAEKSEIDKKIDALKKQQADLRAKMDLIALESVSSKINEAGLRVALKKIEDEIAALVKRKELKTTTGPLAAKTTTGYFQLFVETKDAAWPFVIKEFGPDGNSIGKTAFENSAVLGRFLGRAMKDSTAPKEVRIIAQANTSVETLTSALEACKAAGVAQSSLKTTNAKQLAEWLETVEKENITRALEAAREVDNLRLAEELYRQAIEVTKQKDEMEKHNREAARKAMEWLRKHKVNEPPIPPKP
jgi:RNA polymerase sigma factor (sigma-70 family)